MEPRSESSATKRPNRSGHERQHRAPVARRSMRCGRRIPGRPMRAALRVLSSCRFLLSPPITPSKTTPGLTVTPRCDTKAVRRAATSRSARLVTVPVRPMALVVRESPSPLSRQHLTGIKGKAKSKHAALKRTRNVTTDTNPAHSERYRVLRGLTTDLIRYQHTRSRPHHRP